MKRDKLVIILGAVLFVSLTANVFMASMMVGNSYMHAGEGDARHAEWQKREEELRKQLPEADRKILKAAMQEHRPQFQALRQELEAARQKVSDAESAEPFDQAALDAALRVEQEKKTALLQMMRQTRDQIAQQLSPEGREIFKKLGPGNRGGGGPGWQGRWHGGARGGGGFDRAPPDVPDGSSAPSQGQNNGSTQP
jgi:Spy/CpxP family protein refolding chaperone